MPPKEREFLLILLCILAFFFFPGRRGREEVEEGSALESGGDTPTNQPLYIQWGRGDGMGAHRRVIFAGNPRNGGERTCLMAGRTVEKSVEEEGEAFLGDLNAG